MRILVKIRPLATQHPSKSFSNQRSYLELQVFLNYFTIIYTNYSKKICKKSFWMSIKNINLNCWFSTEVYLFSHFFKSDTTFDYSLERGSVQIRPLFTGLHHFIYCWNTKNSRCSIWLIDWVNGYNNTKIFSIFEMWRLVTQPTIMAIRKYVGLLWFLIMPIGRSIY